MNPSLSVNHRPPVSPMVPARRKTVVPPGVLRAAGILSDPQNPDHALRRGLRLLGQGRYRAARDLVRPHLRSASGRMRLQIVELLARCATQGAGGDWEALLRAALDGYKRAGDMLGVARMRRDLGEMLVQVGRYREADLQLREAASGFRRFDDEVGGASVERIRARIRMNAGFTRRALQRLDTVVATLERHDEPRILARALLDRARALAQRGDGPAAARDLVAAERILGSSSSAVDRLRARLTRADCLIRLGEPLRAAHGLKRVLVDVVELEEVPVRAWAHELLGQALADTSPSSSRRYLMRARHLYASIEYEAAVAECEIYLAQAEHRIGLNGRGRLEALRKCSFADWPRLAAEMNIVRAEVEGSRRPGQARRSLLKARAFAIESGDGALLREADAALCASDGADDAQVEPLTPVPDADTELAATIRDSDDLVPIARPEPRAIHEAPGRLTGRLRAAARFLERDSPSGGRVVLRPPRAAGVPV